MSHKKRACNRITYAHNKQAWILYTQEVLLIKKGKVKVNFYDKEKKFTGAETVSGGDVILLCAGGHGFEILEDTVMIEIKQGPYTGLDDKDASTGGKMQMIPVNEPLVTEKEVEYVTEAVKTGWISSEGKYIKAFEEKFGLT